MESAAAMLHVSFFRDGVQKRIFHRTSYHILCQRNGCVLVLASSFTKSILRSLNKLYSNAFLSGRRCLSCGEKHIWLKELRMALPKQECSKGQSRKRFGAPTEIDSLLSNSVGIRLQYISTMRKRMPSKNCVCDCVVAIKHNCLKGQIQRL